MSDILERYYERELEMVQEYARQFARQYPAEAGRLQPAPDLTIDPHAERFIEGFALLTGRIRHKIDCDFPELTEALLAVLYPHLLAPVPSMTIAQFESDPQRPMPPEGIHLPQHVRLRTRPMGRPPHPCRWRTGYPVSLWPVRLTEARLQPGPLPSVLGAPPRTAAALILRLECLDGLRFADLALDRLRFYLSGENQMIAGLYEAIFNRVTQVVFRNLDIVSETPSRRLPPVVLRPEECLGQVGFNLDEGLLAWPSESFAGYRLLTELFAFREKFLFLDLGGWQAVRAAGFGNRVEVVLFLDRTQVNLEQGVNATTFQLGCTPIVNLFEQSAQPIALTQARYEYRIVPARPMPLAAEVVSVDEVTALDPDRDRHVQFQPFYSFGVGQTRANQHAFWYTSRRASTLPGDRGTDVWIVLVDRQFDPTQPAEMTLDVRTTCSNRDVPVRFGRAGDELFAEEIDRDLPGPVHCLHVPTASLRPPLRRSAHWRLLAQNCLNHVPLSDPEHGRAALQEILRLCDLADPTAGHELLAAINRQMVEGVTGLRGRRVTRPVRGVSASNERVGYCRGVEFQLELDEQKYVGTGTFLFACVLERFLGLYAAVNSFSQLIARTKQAEGYLKRWPPRAVEQQLL
jgi:type VI secretion system protein ImpG